MAPKRKASEALDDVDKFPYHANFSLYPEADLVVETSSGILFATRSLHLRSASSVFDDILSLPPQDDQEKKDGLALIKIDEPGEVFEIFLRYAHRGRLLVDGKGPEPSWESVLLLSKLLDKYDPSNLTSIILAEQLPRFIRNPLVPSAKRSNNVVAGTDVKLPPCVQVFAVAAIHGMEDLAKRSLRWNHVWGKVPDDAVRTPSS